MRFNVNRERCEGFGLCAESAPDLLHLDDDGELTVLHDPVPRGKEAAAEAAGRVCPLAALQVDP